MKRFFRYAYRFIGLKFLDNPCPACGGEGSVKDFFSFTLIPCDYCYGSGKKADMRVTLAWIFMMIALTIAPFAAWWLW